MLENLRCSREGLTTVSAEERLTIFGHNKLEEKRVLFHFYSCSYCSLVNSNVGLFFFLFFSKYGLLGVF